MDYMTGLLASRPRLARILMFAVALIVAACKSDGSKGGY